jgi:hypothetical protein
MSKLKILVLALALIMAFGAVNAGAQVRLDVDIPWLIAAGVTLEGPTGDPELASINLAEYHIPLPYLEIAYQFGDGFLTGGIGLRAYTLIVEFMGWPMGYVELNLAPVVLRAELGGGAFFLFGIINQLYCTEYTLQVMIPDISASFAFTDWFRAGAGITMVAPIGNLDNFGWIFYIDARFAFLFRDKEK